MERESVLINAPFKLLLSTEQLLNQSRSSVMTVRVMAVNVCVYLQFDRYCLHKLFTAIVGARPRKPMTC